MATTRLALVLVAPLLVSCGTRYHLAGEVDGGSLGGSFPSDGAGTGGDPRGAGGRGAAGVGGPDATGGGGAGGTPAGGSVVGPVPLPISPREAVTRVARVLWESPPDEALVALADSGTLTTNEDVRRTALSMLADSRSRAAVGHFYRWWLNLDALAMTAKDPNLYPEYSAALGAAMAAETEAFALNVTFDGDGRFPTLMRGSYSFINGPLADLYGIPDVTGSDLRKVDLDPTQRAGVLTQGAFLSQTSGSFTWTSPTRRGLFVARQILCKDIPAPPPDVVTEVPPAQTDPTTNRQKLERSMTSPSCMTCHSEMDPFGFAYEGFDSIGRVRLTDSGLPIDTSGYAIVDSGAHSWKNAIDLAQILASSQEAHVCMGRQWLRYVLGRLLTAADESSVVDIARLFEAGGLDLRTAIAAAVSSASFLATTGGPPCTAGLPQTCNEDPLISSIRGSCTPAGKCVCTVPSAFNPATGRCM
jgi:uncharacterized protein DUF1592/uncharacterized protein DUF1588/uncharacterized protein DUF1585